MADDTPQAGVAAVLAYHDRTKHSFQRFARSLGYLDWATQPDPFRRYAGAPLVELPRVPLAGDGHPLPLTADAVAECLRCAFGLTAWKQAGASRWALRANPSSGNLHPTEAYLVARAGASWRVSHYAPREHALETRAELDSADLDLPPGVCLVGLSSIHWREAWKYGERAFRYCQHDVGHAIGALAYSAARLGWRVRLLMRWSDADVEALLGLPSGASGAEAEHPDCLLAVGPGEVDRAANLEPGPWVAAAAGASWLGQPNQLSADHVDWPAIDSVTAATRRGREEAGPDTAAAPSGPSVDRAWLLRRRSAVSFDGRGHLGRDAFARLVARVEPGADRIPGREASPVWSAGLWPPQIRLVWFVHRVEGLAPGIYGQPRDPAALEPMRRDLRDDLLWEPVDGIEGLFLLAPLDARGLAQRLSCDQGIAADGYFGMAMLAPLAPALDRYGPWFYRALFWECGLIGQVLYLEAEIAGGRSTGIGCFYDDPVHEVLGIEGHGLQSLYHFSMGVPVDDARLSTAPGYPWD